MKKPYILCAAVHVNDPGKYVNQPKNIRNGFVICGRRHHNCFGIIQIMKDNGAELIPTWYKQGFITSDDRFVDRKEAFVIAKEAKQIIEKHGPSNILFSEDLYQCIGEDFQPKKDNQ